MAKSRNYTQGKTKQTLNFNLELLDPYKLSKNRSASNAAMQPEPAEVMAWR